jgi:hypothetical protein
MSLRSEFRIVMSAAIIASKRSSVRLCYQLSVGGLMSYLRYLCLLAHSGVQVILYCTLCFGCLSLVYPILSVSLDCPFLIDPSVLCNVYLIVLEHTPIPTPTHPPTHTHTYARTNKRVYVNV